jgi:hypothetical protein
MSETSRLSAVRAPDGIRSQIAILREMMLSVQHFDESMWLAAAVSFPRLCESPAGQRPLRSAATIAWRFGFFSVTMWINAELLSAPDTLPIPAKQPRQLWGLPRRCVMC